ncbi:uncharacterized protein DUF87 [Paenibacillus cellulosilyticus]|uniref:Uncharacterized protein DUF87 n=1 Tax=Paenibacillus cellulosilyticus TaxID=375489 RepID=A0A2V2YSS4_9BACL|nr:DUF87 domain-containing protein [Paenibacillus cellulosilyticus]PWW01209.1 uncharacterized protein DUF87 [Paenibacillus cellulosilyticus]QKS46836.1 DUF87 domain-containing protein [Paenibacillus cellulosilyticus]
MSAVRRLIKGFKKNKKHTIVNPVAEGKDQKNGHLVRVLMIKDYPPIILAGYLDHLEAIVRTEGAELRKTIRYAGSDVKFSFGMKTKLARLNKSINAATVSDPARKEEVATRDTIIELRDSAYTGNRKLLEVWTFLTIAAPEAHQLDAAEIKLNSWFDNVSGELDTLVSEQQEALRQTSPVSDRDTSNGEFFRKKHYGRVTTDSAAARTYPMTRGSFSDDQGPYFGRRTEDGSFCFINLCDPNDSRAQNLTVFGKTGEGKSFFMKALVVSLLEEGVHVFVFDLDGEWRELCEEVGGVYIDHTADNGRYFEPLTIMPKLAEIDQDCIEYNRTRYTQALQNGIRTLSLLADGLTKGEVFEAGEAIKRVFASAGIDRENQATWDGPYAGPRPTIHAAFAAIQSEAEANADAKSLWDKIKIYSIGIYDNLFKHEEPLEFQRAPLVVYKVGSGRTGDNEQDESARQAQLKMSMAFDTVNANIVRLKYEGAHFSAVLVDEGQRQLQNSELKRAVFDWYTAIRKWNGMMILGSNTPAIMLDSAEGVGMWENTNIRVYFYLEQSAIRTLARSADMPEEIQDRIAQNAGSRRFILEYHKQYDELFMDVPEEESKLYATRGLKKMREAG